MRKIEQEMLQAIENKADKWVKDNTSVWYVSAYESGNPHGARSEVLLHGNCIGEYWHESKTFEPCLNTFKRWPTMTTASRLRALGVNATIRKGKACIGGEEV
jgi:hypothetical protein